MCVCVCVCVDERLRAIERVSANPFPCFNIMPDCFGKSDWLRLHCLRCVGHSSQRKGTSRAPLIWSEWRHGGDSGQRRAEPTRQPGYQLASPRCHDRIVNWVKLCSAGKSHQTRSPPVGERQAIFSSSERETRQEKAKITSRKWGNVR